MSIRPIDFQVGVTRSVENARLNSNENMRPDIQQQAFAKELDKQVELESTQVVQTNKSEFNKVNEDGRGGKNKQERRDKKDPGKGKDKKEAAKQNKNSSSMYDISI